jgi:hypothetical protein
MPRSLKISLAILLGVVAVGVVYFRVLRGQLQRLARPALTEEQARRQVTRPLETTSAGAKAKAKLYWLSDDSPETLVAEEEELALSSDPAERARQLITALIEQAPDPSRRTLPAEASLLEIYVLDDGSAFADFSGELATALPSGILSERLAVDSIVRTLAENVPKIKRLKIFIHGQEVETLAGHLDLTGYFPVRAEDTSKQSRALRGDRLTAESAPGKLMR